MSNISGNDIQNATHNAAQKTTEAVDKAADKAHDVTNAAVKGAHDAVKATRETANETINKAEEKVKEWSSEIDPAISELASKAQALAEKSINYCAHTGMRLREQMDDATVATTRYVSQQPGKSLLIAAATGSLLTMVAMMLARSGRD